MDGVPGVKPFAIIACVLGAALAGCAGQEISVEAPAWKSGFSWAYQWEASGEWASEEDGEREDESWSETGVTRAEVLNTTMEIGGIPVYLVAYEQGDGDGDRRTGMEVVRQRDLASLPYGMDVEVSCMNDACSTSYSGLELHDVDVPTWLDFPLEGGKSWSQVVGGDDGDDPGVLHRGAVTGAAAVDTPLGTVSAVRVDFIETVADPDRFRAAILAEAEDEGYDVDTLRIDVHSQATAYYSPEYQTTVRYESRERFELAATGTDPDGERFDFRETGDFTFRSIIEGARLVARAERTLEEAISYLAGEIPVDDPTGKLVEEVPFSIAIKSGVDTVNTAEGESFSFSAEVDGNGSLPDGVSLRWSLLDWKADEVAAGKGDAFSPTVAVPGRYSVALEAVDGDGEILAAAGARAYGDLEARSTLDCGPVATFFSDCSTTLPVHPGVRHLHVEARSTLAGLPVDQRGSLEVSDAAGQEVPVSNQGGAWVVDMASFSGYALGEPAWDLHWENFASVAEEVELGVTILYSTGVPAVQVSVGSGALADPSGIQSVAGPWHAWTGPVGEVQAGSLPGGGLPARFPWMQ